MFVRLAEDHVHLIRVLVEILLLSSVGSFVLQMAIPQIICCGAVGFFSSEHALDVGFTAFTLHGGFTCCHAWDLSAQ